MVQIAVGLVTTLSVFTGNEVQVVNTQSSSPQDSITIIKEVSPQDYLRSIAGKDFDLLNTIIICESGWHADAQNKTSSAGGLFQFIDSTWSRYASPGWEKYDPYRNIDAGWALYQKEGTNPWLASKSCWSKNTP